MHVWKGHFIPTDKHGKYIAVQSSYTGSEAHINSSYRRFPGECISIGANDYICIKVSILLDKTVEVHYCNIMEKATFLFVDDNFT